MQPTSAACRASGGGIHPPADDIPGRLIGARIGRDAFRLALSLFDGSYSGRPLMEADSRVQGSAPTMHCRRIRRRPGRVPVYMTFPREHRVWTPLVTQAFSSVGSVRAVRRCRVSGLSMRQVTRRGPHGDARTKNILQTKPVSPPPVWGARENLKSSNICTDRGRGTVWDDVSPFPPSVPSAARVQRDLMGCSAIVGLTRLRRNPINATSRRCAHDLNA